MTTHEETGTDRHECDITRTVEQIAQEVCKLPEGGDAARVRGIAYRLAAAAQDGSEPVWPLARRLAAAAGEAVEADPWVAIDRLARRLLEMCESTSVDNVPIAASTTVTAGKRMSERRHNPNQGQLRKRRAEQQEQWNARRPESLAGAESQD